ncbi:olfactory receptor 14A16-like [Talpa occidentalis]|uniref:olfactory receptor 14A16-like n=1 Tax=Talpa occidentalis TaxID=50954 RepID=UPI0023F6ABB9|nr:olfactory receptor 14A16-like [Talpa occidentalis]
MMSPMVTNLTTVTEFVLLGFPTQGTMGFLHPLLFSLVYLCALLGNGLIVLITTLDRHLHTPMYFFLRSLSFLDLCLITTTVPKSIANSLRRSSSISFPGCVVQVFVLILSAGGEMTLLTVMSLDRYAAICHPLHYDVIMSRDRCEQLTAVSWLGGGLYAVMNTAGTFSLSYCGSNVVHQFFCDAPQLLAISCSENVMNKLVPILISAVLTLCSFIFIIISYVHIFSAVRKIPSTEDDGPRGGDQSHDPDRFRPPEVSHPGDHGLLAPLLFFLVFLPRGYPGVAATFPLTVDGARPSSDSGATPSLWGQGVMGLGEDQVLPMEPPGPLTGA